MSEEKTIIGDDKIVSFDKIVEKKGLKEPLFSEGFYHWVMFILTLYTRVRENLKIDFESFVILQVVVSHSVYQINKTGQKTYSQLENQITNILQKKNTKGIKLTFASISDVLQLPRETVRRKVIKLSKRKILTFNSNDGIKLGSEYKTIYKKFVTQTTLDMSSVLKKWKKIGALDNLLGLEN